MDKQEIREKIKLKRKALKKTEAKKKSRLIAMKFLITQEFLFAKTVFLYTSFKNEVDTRELIQVANLLGKKVALPVVDKKRHEIFFREFKGFKKMKKDAFGILEPEKSCRKVPARKADLIVVPGIAFDKSGNRIGFGKGYYDRFLKKVKRTPKIALAYDFQIVKKIPATRKDVKVDWIITESRIIKC